MITVGDVRIATGLMEAMLSIPTRNAVDREMQDFAPMDDGIYADSVSTEGSL